MNEYQPQILWELTRAAVCIAAWWVLFYRLHRPAALWRRITLLVANAVSWAVITVVFAFICGDLRRSLVHDLQSLFP